MSDGTKTRGGLGGIASLVLSPVGRVLALVLAPIDLVMQPLASVYNRTLGRFYGEVNGLQLLLLLLGFGGVIGLPYVLETVFGVTGYHRAFGLAAIWAIFAMSWDIQSGYTGYISFGHSVLSGAAAYAMGMLLWHTEIQDLVARIPVAQSFNQVPVLPDAIVVLTFLFGILTALVVGLLIALPTLRLEGPYFSLLTFVAVLLFMRLIPAFGEWTGGAQQGINLDLHGGPDFVLFEINPDLATMNYFIILIPLLLVTFVLVTISRSNVGLILVAIRENESAVAAAGINPTKFKLWSFVLSSIPMGIGGVLLAHYMRQISMQELVIVDISIEMIAMAVVGGMSSILGPLFAAFGFVFLEQHLIEQLLHALPVVGEDYKFLLLWIVVIAVLVFARRGLLRWLWNAAGAVRGDSE